MTKSWFVYLFIMIISIVIAYVLPRLCFYVTCTNFAVAKMRIKGQKGIIMLLSIVYFFGTFLILSTKFFYSEKYDLLKQQCEAKSGEYIIQKSGDKVCIEKSVYEDYKLSMKEMQKKLSEAQIVLE
jgi:hypothetical protein